MSVKIGSARIDERGKARGGKAGDQTGRELSVQNWYNRITNPWVLIRAKDPAHREKIARCMEMACANQKIGYDQGGRDTLYSAAAVYQFDVSRVAKAVETDCSALVRVCARYAVGLFVENFRTTNEASVLMKTGLFSKFTTSKYIHSSAYLMRGDILVTKRQGHTVVVLSDGEKAGEESTVSITPPTDPPESYNCNWCVATAAVNVRKGPGTGYGVKMKLAVGEAVMYDNAVSGDWYAVYIQGKRYWVSAKFVKIAVGEKPIIDISRWNRIKDWNELAKRVSFVFIRVGYRSLTSGGAMKIDSSFKAHAAAANAANIPFGAYFYGRGKTATQGAQEAMNAVEWAGQYKPTVYAYDVETATNTQTAVQAFVDTAEGIGGAPCGTYIGRRWKQVNGDALRRAFQWSPYHNTGKNGPSWLLFHGRNPSHPHDFHQYSSSFLVGGAAAGIDVSHVNNDPETTYKGRDVLWLCTGGKQAVTKG